jgi:hypothetical protein
MPRLSSGQVLGQAYAAQKGGSVGSCPGRLKLAGQYGIYMALKISDPSYS